MSSHPVYSLPDDRGGSEMDCDRSYEVLQPHFRRPERSVPPRDRYRSAREDIYDEGDAYGYDGRGMQFDSFDQELLQQPYDDRARQAAQGRARLSFAPNPFKISYGGGASSQPQPAGYDRAQDGYGMSTQGYVHSQDPHLSQYGFNTTQTPEASSDVPLGTSSSPAFKAGQRRAAADHQHKLAQADLDRRFTHVEEAQDPIKEPPVKPSGPKASRLRTSSNVMDLPHPGAVVQGIPLVPVAELPDRLRSTFPFPVFNAVQSKSFDKAYGSNDNFVLAAPTGSGKTAIMELAICRAFVNNASGQYKIVYQAPTKALCSERQRDWQRKFQPLGLNCAELTGDSDGANLRNVQTANIIVTTPEKWDSVTRKWKDHAKLMELVTLFLIDEVHTLKEDRGATLETVVSRMKTIGTEVRFIALSATVPNLQDVAKWLGKSASQPHEPANSEKFGEEFRPVRLRKHVYGYNFNTPNDFAFDKYLDSKLPEVIAKHSERKPIMVFCLTRNAAVSTAQILASWWTSRSPRDRYWSAPSKQLSIHDKALRECFSSGVAFHHAGLDLQDRDTVEKGFLHGEIYVICCTSTLAVGVNLPCHFAIIKNTVRFSRAGIQEYSDLEVMQMLGRAGRPQFDTSAVAVIMTRSIKARRYEMMVTGQDVLESRLHLNLIDHLNAEIGLGTIHDLASAKKWLAGTFLYVRLKQNPCYYKLEGSRSGQSIDEQLDEICERDISLLQENQLVTPDPPFHCTESGHAMARYYVHFETMKLINGLQPKPSLSEILSALAQAAEFNDLRFRASEKALYKTLNRSPSIRFPIQVTLNSSAHKVSLILQAVLGGAEPVWDNETSKHKTQYNLDETMVFNHAYRLIRCVIDCQLCTGDAVAIRNAMILECSIGARVWDDSPLQMKQIAGLGTVSVRKFVNAGIRSNEELELTEPHRIESIIGRNPPFGLQLLDKLKGFPKLRVSIQAQANTAKRVEKGVRMELKTDIGFLNDNPVTAFNGKFIYICLLVETSDAQKLHFARISGHQLGKGRNLTISVLLTDPSQSVNCYVMCESIAGTMRSAMIKPKIAPSLFPQPKISAIPTPEPPRSNMSRRRSDSVAPARQRSAASDDFGDDGVDDEDLVKASFGDLDFDHIENYANPTHSITRKNTAKNSTKGKAKAQQARSAEQDDDEPTQLETGRWACNHKCKDKTACKHFCCRDGLEKPPKKQTKKAQAVDTPEESSRQQPKKVQSKLQLSASKRKQGSGRIEVLDLTQQEKKRKTEYAGDEPAGYRNLHQLHKSVQGMDVPASVSSIMTKKPGYCYARGGEPSLSFLSKDPHTDAIDTQTTDSGNAPLEELLSHFEGPESSHQSPFRTMHSTTADFDDMDQRPPDPPTGRSDLYGDDDSMLNEALVGLADSQELQVQPLNHDHDHDAFDDPIDLDNDYGFRTDDFEAEMESNSPGADLSAVFEAKTSSTVNPPMMQPEKSCSLFLKDTNSPQSQRQPACDRFRPARHKLAAPELQKMRQAKPVSELKQSDTLSDENTPVFMKEGITEVDMATHDEAKKAEEIDAVDPDKYKDLEPWFLAEFGDIVELVSG